MKVFYIFLLVLVFRVVSSHGRTHEYNARTPFETFRTEPNGEFLCLNRTISYYLKYYMSMDEPGFEPGGPKHEPKKFHVTWFIIKKKKIMVDKKFYFIT